MGAYITNETADQDPITNPFGTHSHIGKYFTNIPNKNHEMSARKNENLVENRMGSYITQERADHGPITNPSGTHIRPNISPTFLKITSPEEGKQKCKYDLVQNRKTQLISTIEAPIHLGPTTLKCDFG